MKNNIAQTSIIVTIILMIGYFIAFLRESIIAYFFGISADVDAYSTAIGLPVNLFSIITLSIHSVVVPIYTKLLCNESQEIANTYASTLITIVAILATTLIIILELLASSVIYVCAPGLAPETHSYTVMQFRLVLPTILFSLINHIYIGINNVHKSFILPSLSVWLLNVSIIIAILVLHSYFGIVAACMGQIIGVLLQFIFLKFVSRKHFHYHFLFDYKSQDMVSTGKQVLPIIWSTAISEVNSIIHRLLASMMFVGAIASLNYAGRINNVLLTFFTSAIAMVVFPLYAESGAKRDYLQLNERVNSTLSIYAFFLLPVMAGMLCLRKELITVAFGRGAFGVEAIQTTSNILACYAIGIFFLAIRESITKVFYSLQDTKTPAKNATLGVLLNIVLCLTLPLLFSVYGLAIASTISAVFVSTRLILQLRKKHDVIKLKAFLDNLKKIILPTTFLAMIMISCELIFQWPVIPKLIIISFLGLLAYLLLSYLLRIPILDKIMKMLFVKYKK